MREVPEREARFLVEPDHPALEGHFPGDPLLPGVVLLDRVVSAVEDWLGADWCVGGLPQVKFLSVLRPGDEAVIQLMLRDDCVRFTVRCGAVAVATGTLARASRATKT